MIFVHETQKGGCRDWLRRRWDAFNLSWRCAVAIISGVLLVWVLKGHLCSPSRTVAALFLAIGFAIHAYIAWQQTQTMIGMLIIREFGKQK